MGTIHPSNRLYNGEARDFLEAVELDRAQCAFEFNRYADLNTDDDRRHQERYLAGIDAAERLYREIVLPALDEAKARCATALRAADLDHYARALEAGDYRGLAI